MGQDIVASVLTLALTFIPLSTPSATQNNLQQKTVQPQINTIVVKKGDSLSAIAQKEYGSTDYWTNIWNDNSQIKDPSLIENGNKIKIEAKKPTKPAELNSDLAKRLQTKAQLAYAEAPKIEQNEVQQPISTSIYTSGPLTQEQINYLGNCESGLTAGRNSGNGYFGAFQFSYGTWRSMGTAYERADQAPLDIQVDAVQRLVSRSSVFTQFPACSQRMRSLGIL